MFARSAGSGMASMAPTGAVAVQQFSEELASVKACARSLGQVFEHDSSELMALVESLQEWTQGLCNGVAELVRHDRPDIGFAQLTSELTILRRELAGIAPMGVAIVLYAGTARSRIQETLRRAATAAGALFARVAAQAAPQQGSLLQASAGRELQRLTNALTGTTLHQLLALEVQSPLVLMAAAAAGSQAAPDPLLGEGLVMTAADAAGGSSGAASGRSGTASLQQQQQCVMGTLANLMAQATSPGSTSAPQQGPSGRAALLALVRSRSEQYLRLLAVLDPEAAAALTASCSSGGAAAAATCCATHCSRRAAQQVSARKEQLLEAVGRYQQAVAAADEAMSAVVIAAMVAEAAALDAATHHAGASTTPSAAATTAPTTASAAAPALRPPSAELAQQTALDAPASVQQQQQAGPSAPAPAPTPAPGPSGGSRVRFAEPLTTCNSAPLLTLPRSKAQHMAPAPPPAPAAPPDVSVPASFVCPITQLVMRDPVSTTTGHTFEAASIRDWFATRSDWLNPVTNVPLSDPLLIPNLSLKGAIEEWLQQHGMQHEDADELAMASHPGAQGYPLLRASPDGDAARRYTPWTATAPTAVPVPAQLQTVPGFNTSSSRTMALHQGQGQGAAAGAGSSGLGWRRTQSDLNLFQLGEQERSRERERDREGQQAAALQLQAGGAAALGGVGFATRITGQPAQQQQQQQQQRRNSPRNSSQMAAADVQRQPQQQGALQQGQQQQQGMAGGTLFTLRASRTNHGAVLVTQLLATPLPGAQGFCVVAMAMPFPPEPGSQDASAAPAARMSAPGTFPAMSGFAAMMPQAQPQAPPSPPPWVALMCCDAQPAGQPHAQAQAQALVVVDMRSHSRVQIPPVRGSVTCLSACPSGGSLAVGTSDGITMLWRLFDGQYGRPGWQLCGRLGWPQEIWDEELAQDPLARRICCLKYRGGRGPEQVLFIACCGGLVAMASLRGMEVPEGQAKVMSDHKALLRTGPCAPSDMALSPDGLWLAIARCDGAVLLIHTARSYSVELVPPPPGVVPHQPSLLPLTGLLGGPWAVAFTPDGHRILRLGPAGPGAAANGWPQRRTSTATNAAAGAAGGGAGSAAAAGSGGGGGSVAGGGNGGGGLYALDVWPVFDGHGEGSRELCHVLHGLHYREGALPRLMGLFPGANNNVALTVDAEAGRVLFVELSSGASGTAAVLQDMPGCRGFQPATQQQQAGALVERSVRCAALLPGGRGVLGGGDAGLVRWDMP